MPESGSLGSVRGAPGNGRPYRDYDLHAGPAKPFRHLGHQVDVEPGEAAIGIHDHEGVGACIETDHQRTRLCTTGREAAGDQDEGKDRPHEPLADGMFGPTPHGSTPRAFNDD